MQGEESELGSATQRVRGSYFNTERTEITEGALEATLGSPCSPFKHALPSRCYCEKGAQRMR